MMSDKNFRFGVNMFATGARSAWRDTARRVEDLGYDVLLIPDHLDMPAPFPAVMSAAEDTARIHLGTMVINAGFYTPALLARDVAAAHELTDGRFELGLGAGWAATEFDEAGLPFPPGGQRFDHLERTVHTVDERLRDVGQHVPLMVGGKGNKMLTLAARHADIVNFDDTPPTGKPRPPDMLPERIDFVRQAAGDRFAELELCLVLSLVQITGSGTPDLDTPRTLYPGLSDEQLLALPGVQHGTVQDIADSLRRMRDDLGITYFATLDQGPNLNALSKVISQLR